MGTFAEDSQTDLKGRINLPAMGGLAVKLTGMSIQGGEYFYNATRNKEEGDNDLTAFTADALFQPNDTFDFRLIYDYIDDETPTRPVASLTAPNEAFAGFGLGVQGKTSEDLYTVTTSAPQPASLRTDAITVHMNWQFSDQHKLAVVFGDRETEETARQEFDGVAADLFCRPTEGKQVGSSGSNRIGAIVSDPHSATSGGTAITRYNRIRRSLTL